MATAWRASSGWPPAPSPSRPSTKDTGPGSATVHAGDRAQAQLKLLEGEARTSVATNGSDASYREQFHFRGFFECSATYVIITGDCMLIVDTVTGSAGLGTPAGDATEEEYMLDARPRLAGERPTARPTENR